MNKKNTIELPENTLCCFVNYVYMTEHGMAMGSSPLDGVDLYYGHKICKRAEGYDKTEGR